MTLKKTTIPKLPVATTFSGGYLLYQQGSTTKRIADTTVINAIENRDLNPIEVTYDQLEVLVLASALISGAKYLITDATTANIPLIVEAVSANKIGTDAKSPDFPQDIIEYDFENDTILWRWDTINDISVAQDLRNLVGLVIQQPWGTNVHCQKGVTGTIGPGSKNWNIGPNAIISSGSENTEIDFAGGGFPNTLNLGDNNVSIKVESNSNFTGEENNIGIKCGSGCDVAIQSNNGGIVVGDGSTISGLNGSQNVEFKSSGGGQFDPNPLYKKVFMQGAYNDWTGGLFPQLYGDTGSGTVYQDGGDGSPYLVRVIDGVLTVTSL